MFPKQEGKLVLTIFFLSLVLMLSPVMNASSTSSVPLNYVDVESEETMEITATGIIFSANSRIFVGRTGWDFNVMHDLSSLRWSLYNPASEIEYFEAADFKETDDAADIGYVNDPEIVVPWFPDQGKWRLKLSVDVHLTSGTLRRDIYILSFDVGESSIVDNVMAPVCVTYGGIAVVSWGEFSWALPGIFWLTSPLWGFAIFFIALAFYFRSFRLATGLLKEGGKRFKEAIKRKKV